ncbi:MAG: patatin-like phospholipase family protein, partial [Candidatus Binatia bacterium]
FSHGAASALPSPTARQAHLLGWRHAARRFCGDTKEACYGSRAVTGLAAPPTRRRTALVLSGGGSRGAYEAGVLSWLFEHIYPKLGKDFEFDIVSGTSVGAIHAAYVACTSGLKPVERARMLVDTWAGMRFETVMRLRWRDLVGIPMRGLGLGLMRRRGRGYTAEAKGGLVDIAPLEELVRTRLPWHRLRANLAAGRPSTLCTTVTTVSSGVVRVFLDGPGAETAPWQYDPHVDAVITRITDLHVRASAAIPFLFPAVRIDDRYYVDGGLRLNTPLSPALRLGAEKVLLVGLGRKLGKKDKAAFADAESLMQPAFLFGKILDVLLLDPIDNELHHLGVINSLLTGGAATFGEDFAERIAPYLHASRGAAYRPVEFFMQTPSDDIGRIAAECYHRPTGTTVKGTLISALIKRAVTMGVPRDEADFLSYVYFDKAFTDRLVELGRADAEASRDRILELLAPEPTAADPPC